LSSGVAEAGDGMAASMTVTITILDGFIINPP
jgi:hypothetical protein